MKAFIVFIGLWLAVGAANASQIDIQQISPDRYQLTYTSETPITLENAQKTLYRPALQVCNDQKPQFEKYTFKRTETLGKESTNNNESLVLVQNINCNAAHQIAHESTTKTLSTEKTASLKRSITERTKVYLDNLEQANFDAAFSTLSPSLTKTIDFKAWKKQKNKFIKTSGPLSKRRIWRVTLYIDPPSAPVAGIYVAADYEESYKQVPFKCGYVIWLKIEDQGYKIIREESGHIDAATAAKISTSDTNQARKSFGCPPA